MSRLSLLIVLAVMPFCLWAQDRPALELGNSTESATTAPTLETPDASAAAASPSLLAKLKAKFSRVHAPGEHTLYAISWEVKQDATLLKKECSALSDAEIVTRSVASPAYDYCACTAKILYPQLHGLSNGKAMLAINDSLAARIEQDGCGTEKPYLPAQGRSGDRKVTRFDVTLAEDRFLSFLIWHDTYGAGAAHNSWILEGVSYDLDSGKVLALADLIAPEKLFEVNEKISETLTSAYPEGAAPMKMTVSPIREEIALEEGAAVGPAAEGNATVPEALPALKAMPVSPDSPPEQPSPSQSARKPADYVSLDGCSGCTYYLTPDGLEIVFQLYEVAPFAEGNPKILIGKEYLKKDISGRL